MPVPFVQKRSFESRVFEIDLNPIVRPSDTIVDLIRSTDDLPDYDSDGSPDMFTDHTVEPSDGDPPLTVRELGIDTDKKVLIFRAEGGEDGQNYKMTFRFKAMSFTSTSFSGTTLGSQFLETCFEIQVNDNCDPYRSTVR